MPFEGDISREQAACMSTDYNDPGGYLEAINLLHGEAFVYKCLGFPPKLYSTNCVEINLDEVDIPHFTKYTHNEDQFSVNLEGSTTEVYCAQLPEDREPLTPCFAEAGFKGWQDLICDNENNPILASMYDEAKACLSRANTVAMVDSPDGCEAKITTTFTQV